ncbi:MAG: helix-turn-helix transcriptional regulator [Acidimicrobiales bacterium]
MLLLQSHGGRTADELALELEVSVRTIYRDLQALAAAGVPVYGIAGPGGGYRLVDGYRSRLTGLTAPEAGALLLVDLSAPLGALGLGSELLAARLKVAAALPQEVRSRAGELAGRVHLDLPGWFETADAPPALPVLADAVLADRKVRFGYRPGSAKRVVDPLGLVLKGRAWYLVARHDERQLTYAVRRMRSPELLDEGFTRPRDFELASTWEALVSEFESSLPVVEVRLRVSPAGLRRLPRLVDSRRRERTDWEGNPDPGEEGWRRLKVTFERLEYAAQELLGLGSDVEVLEPAELRATMVTAADSLARMYGRTLDDLVGATDAEPAAGIDSVICDT